MHPVQLSTLPHDILCCILERADSLRTVLDLALTARAFHLAWRASTVSICLAVVPRSRECYSEAQELASTQASVARITDQNHQDHNHTVHIDYLKSLLANAREASLACDLFSQKLKLYGMPSLLLPRTETRATFLDA